MRVLLSIGIVGVGTTVAWLAGGESLVQCAALAFGVNLLAFVPAYLRRTEVFYDLVGSLTYLSLVGFALALGESGWRGMVLAGCVGVWAIRLGSFLFRRISRDGKDGRFDDIKQSAGRFLVAWTLQGAWALLTSLACLVLLTGGSSADPAWTDLGFGIWLAGFAIEVVADQQKNAFRARGGGGWIDEGLWRWCQHPNYFGEITLWTGLFIVAAGHLTGWGWLAVLSPLMVVLLLTQVSGIPMLRERADARWGDDRAYQEYRTRTPVLIPRPPR